MSGFMLFFRGAAIDKPFYLRYTGTQLTVEFAPPSL